MRVATFIFGAGVLFAQSDPKPVVEWIHSQEPLKQAWAAHWIVEQHTTSLIPDLRRVIEGPGASSDTDAAKFAALDALIQLDAQVPLGDLEPLVERFPTDVLILAERSSEDATALLLKLLDRPHNREALEAIGNQLTPKRVPGFAKVAMKEFCQRVTVYVYLPDQPHDRGGAWSGDSYRIADPQRAGWPETGSYRIGGASLERSVDRSYIDHGFDFSNESSSYNSCTAAAEFLATYLETSPKQLSSKVEERLDLTWTSEPAFEAALRGYIAEQRQGYAIMAVQLASRGYLTESEASQAHLNLRIVISDARKADQTPLPDVSPNGR